MTYKINLNQTGTHSLDITEEQLKTIQRYSLFHHLVDSNGYVDDDVLSKLKLTVRSIISGQTDCKDLFDLCIDVIYHDKMKAYGLNQLIRLYEQWVTTQPVEQSINEESNVTVD